MTTGKASRSVKLRPAGLGRTGGSITRIVKLEIRTGCVQEFAYRLDNIGSASKPKYTTVSEILAINNKEFLVDERDGKGLGVDSTAVHKTIYRIDLTNDNDFLKSSR